ncbi:hypothetical protein NDU88_001810 [Pleurodeles waltl]|uniref:Uncharacterized protein n=1 Tax=Pleurodeles waltl TaxID=8319 RepID=A0AAV7LE89_PLEWA|nr:hypothetical protein NDU88_001810 [Pleurodeles waltl]
MQGPFHLRIAVLLQSEDRRILSFLVPPGSWFCRARKERGVLFNFGAIRASHTPHKPAKVAKKRRGSRSVERNRSAGLGRAPRSHILAGPSGACRRGPDPSGGRQKAVKRPQQYVLDRNKAIIMMTMTLIVPIGNALD